jgi:hypothetical protein
MGVGTSLLTRCLLLKKREESGFWPRLQAGIWLTGAETGNPAISNNLAGLECSPPPMQRADLVAYQTCFQPSRLSGVSSTMHLVNSAPQRRRSSVEGGSTYVVVGETWKLPSGPVGQLAGRSLGTKSAIGRASDLAGRNASEA